MNSDYARIERAIRYLDANRGPAARARRRGEHVGLSPAHFQRMFTRWAGISPKRFLQHRTAEVVKRLLREHRSVLDVSYEAGLSGLVAAARPDRERGSRLAGRVPAGRRGPRGEVRIPSVAVRRMPHRRHAARHLPPRVREPRVRHGALERLRHDWPRAEMHADQAATREAVARAFPVGGPEAPAALAARQGNELPAEGLGGAAEHPRWRRHDLRRHRRIAARAGCRHARWERRSGATP